MFKLLKQFQKMQGEMKKVQGEMAKEKVIGSSGAGMVEVTINGKFELIDVHIEKRLLEGKDAEMLEDLMVSAVNNGISKVRELIKQKMAQFTGGLNISEMGIPELFSG
ncbi:MAG: YbaB/EbfC family nucleoid-associated protein [Candidatus Aerophobetes bacterium]|nr:YbaB/EbfC family nucleoid-associated protein [Candidatus Aerophobetes bacterium]